jgi:hypothetical protein
LKGLLLHRVLEVAAEEGDVLEVPVGARGGVASVDADRLVGPLPAEPEVAPGADVVVHAALAVLREDRVDLLQGQAGLHDRVVAMDEDRKHVDGGLERRRLVPVSLLEVVLLLGLHRAAHRGELRSAGDQGDRAGRGALALDLDLHVGIEGLEPVGPQRHLVVHGVAADALDVAGHRLDRGVLGQLRIDLDLGGRDSRGGESESGRKREDIGSGADHGGP